MSEPDREARFTALLKSFQEAILAGCTGSFVVRNEADGSLKFTLFIKEISRKKQKKKKKGPVHLLRDSERKEEFLRKRKIPGLPDSPTPARTPTVENCRSATGCPDTMYDNGARPGLRGTETPEPQGDKVYVNPRESHTAPGHDNATGFTQCITPKDYGIGSGQESECSSHVSPVIPKNKMALFRAERLASSAGGKLCEIKE